MILTLSIICVIFLILFVFGALIDSENMAFLGIAGFLIVAVVGFGVICPLFGNKMKVEKIQTDTITITNKNVYVEFSNGEEEKYDKIEDLNKINDSTSFYKISYYNYYGFINSEKITYDEKYEKFELNKKIDKE
jgi:hypothetical protein